MPGESQPTTNLQGTAGTPTSSFPSIDEGRFPAGTTLAGRFRILGLLGKGGMGEVYRALDLTLNQPVALKFIALDARRDEAALARFRNEVRIARQVPVKDTPLAAASWYAALSLTTPLLIAAAAAWSLYVIVTSRPGSASRPASESAI